MEHITPTRVYVLVLIALLFLTGVTVLAAKIDFGSHVINNIVAIAIAVTKATLVVLFFMHVYYSSPMVRFYAIAGAVWVFIFFVIGFTDYVFRGVIGIPGI